MNEETKQTIIRYLKELKNTYKDDFDDYSIGVKIGLEYAIDAIEKNRYSSIFTEVIKNG